MFKEERKRDGNTWRNYPARNASLRSRSRAYLVDSGFNPMEKPHDYMPSQFMFGWKNGSREKISLEKEELWRILEDPQTFADETGHMIIVDQSLSVDWYKDKGVTNRQPWGYGGGDVQSDEYRQVGKSEKITVYEPTDIAQRPAKEPITIFAPIDKDDYRMYQPMRKRANSPCACCFAIEGRIWMTKGLGKKAKCKNKGMRREGKRDEVLN